MTPASPPAAALRLEAVRYAYAGTRRWVLDGVDLEIAGGRVMGVIGANEAGKSTLCLVAAGLAPAAIGGRLEGEVRIGGLLTATADPHEVAQRAGILFQNPITQLSATAPTVYEEVAFGPRNLGLPVGEIADRVENALATLRIEALAPRDPMRLSGGQAQLVALAAVVALRPPVLVLDEPTSQLDPGGTRLVGETLAGLAADTGIAILVVEHKTSLLADLADECALVADGRIVVVGPAAEVLADDRLVELGVEPPPAVRLRRAATTRGIAIEASLLEDPRAGPGRRPARPAWEPAT
jgi:energy-coupling factor transport system ATP-binding protein